MVLAVRALARWELLFGRLCLSEIGAHQTQLHLRASVHVLIFIFSYSTFFFFFSLSFFPFLFPSYFFILITPFTQIITLVIAIDAHWPGSVNETADNAKSISYSHLFQVVPHSVWTQRLSSKNCKQLTSSFPRSSRLSAQSLFRFQAFEPTTLYLFACL